MKAPALITVAHGSRDPRSAATVSALVDKVRRLRPELDVRLSFIDLCAPRLADVLRAVHGAGHHEAVVVPLLLSAAYHARVDVPAAVQRATARYPRLVVRVADVLGPDPRVSAIALHRLAEVGAPLDDSRLGVVLAAAGSSQASANAPVVQLVGEWARRAGWAGGRAAFAAAAQPDVAQAMAALRAQGARRIAVGSWFLAPGLLPDQVAAAAIAADPTVTVAAPLGADRGVAEVILDRYAAALRIEAQERAYAAG